MYTEKQVLDNLKLTITNKSTKHNNNNYNTEFNDKDITIKDNIALSQTM